jgi:hypothetical protein
MKKSNKRQRTFVRRPYCFPTGLTTSALSIAATSGKSTPHYGKVPTGVTGMNKMKLALLAAGLLTSLPVLAQTAGGTENTGPQGTGNFVAGQTERYGVPVAGKVEGTGNPVAGQPADKMDEMKKMEKK